MKNGHMEKEMKIREKLGWEVGAKVQAVSSEGNNTEFMRIWNIQSSYPLTLEVQIGTTTLQDHWHHLEKLKWQELMTQKFHA